MHLRAQLVSLRHFRRRARVVGDEDGGSPLFAIGPGTLAFDPETHEFWRSITCQRCGASVEKAVRDRLDIGTEELFVCWDCARVPLEETPGDHASSLSPT